LSPGLVIANDFRIESPLSKGGMGAVYLVRQISTGKPRALKVMLPHLVANTDLRRRFELEARVAASIDSDHVIEVYAAGVDAATGYPYLVTELLDGSDLAHRVQENGPLPVDDLLFVLGQAFHAIRAAHAVGVVHRDLKPENLFWARSRRADARLVVKVLDFGIAKVVVDAGGGPTAAMGTPLWMAPEQTRRGPVTLAADVWSLGLVTFFLLTGRCFWRTPNTGGDAIHLLREITNDAIPAASERARELGCGGKIPEGFDHWFSRSVAREVTERFTEAGAQWAALEPLLTAKSARAAVSVEPPIRLQRPPREHGSTELLHAAQPSPTSVDPTAPTLAAASRDARETTLDAIGVRVATLPEPLAVLANWVGVARAENDESATLHRALDLTSGVLRYAVAAGLALLDARGLRGHALGALQGRLRVSGQTSDADWLELARDCHATLAAVAPSLGELLQFVTDEPAAVCATARDRLVLGQSPSQRAFAATYALLAEASPLLNAELRRVVSLEPGSFELRMGVPLSRGVRPIGSGVLPAGAAADSAYVVFGDEWIPIDPWLPRQGERLLLPQMPTAAGRSWRSFDPDSGDQRDAPELNLRVLRLLGETESPAQPLSDVPTLIGREASLQSMNRAAKEAVAGNVRVTLLSSAPGMGRTRLLREIAASAPGLGFGLVVQVGCSPDRRGPFRPLRAAGEALVHAPKLQCALDAAVTASASATRESLDAAIESVEEALVSTSHERAVLLAVDDIQWADEPTLAVFRLIVERAAQRAKGKLFLLLSARDEPNTPAGLQRLVSAIEQEVGAGATRLVLEGVSEADSHALVQAVGPVSREMASHVVEGAAGTPFFVVQPLLVWWERGDLEWRGSSWSPRSPSLLQRPAPGVAELVKTRLLSYFEPGTSLARTAETMLAVVALAGELSWTRLERTLTKLGSEIFTVDRAAEVLVDAGLLVAGTPLRAMQFRQPIVRYAARDLQAGRPWFARAHRTLLEVVAEAPDASDAAFLASGYDSLGLVEQSKQWSAQAFENALGAGDFEQAIAVAERMEELSADDSELATAILSSAEALVRAGEYEAASARLERMPAASVVPPTLRARHRSLLRKVGFSLGRVPARVDSSIIANADATGDAMIAIEARLVEASIARSVDSLALLDTAEALLARIPSGRVGDARYRLRSLRVELLYELKVRPETWRHEAELARAAARDVGSKWAELDVVADLAVMEVEAGEVGEGIAALTRVADRAAELGFGTIRRNALLNIAASLRRAGRHADAVRAAVDAADAAREVGSWRHEATALSIQAGALSDLGELREALDAVHRSVELRLSRGDPRVVVGLVRRAEILLRLGDSAAGRVDLEKAIELAERAGNRADACRARLMLAVEQARAGTPMAQERILEILMDEASAELERTTDGRALLAEARGFVAGPGK